MAHALLLRELYITFYNAVQCLVCETRVPLSCLWLWGIWAELSCDHGPARQRMPLLQVSSASGPHSPLPRPAHLFDFFWITWMWLSALVVLDRSLKHQGSTF